MKLSLVMIILFLLVSIYIYSNNGGGVEASSSITKDHANYIKQQLDAKGIAVDEQFEKLAKSFDPHSRTEEIFFYVKLPFNFLSSLLSIGSLVPAVSFESTIGSIACDVITKVLDTVYYFIDKSKDGVGYTIARGIQGLIDQEMSSYNVKYLGAEIKGVSDRMNDFYNLKTDGQFDIFLQASLLDDDFIESKAEFQKPEFQLDTIGLFTLYANSHLIFLYDMVTNGKSKYNFTLSQVQYYQRRLESKIIEYREYIDQIDIQGLDAINMKIKTNNIRYQDEWNERNDYNNFMNLYVYSISNYWDFLNINNYPNGMFIEDAHVSLSKLFGTPFKGINHQSSNEIDKYLLDNNVYQYQGKLKGIYYKNYKCNKDKLNFNLVKYFGGRQYFFREGVERDTIILGDDGKLAGARQYFQICGNASVDSVIQYLSRDKLPQSFSRDYHWGLRIADGSKAINITDIGDVSVYKTNTTISFPDKIITSVLPISYGKCSIGCSGKEGTDYLVESAVIGFVNKDIVYDNVVLEFTGSMVDAQKYINYTSFNNLKVSYSRDGYKRYKHSMLIPSNIKITYKIIYNPFIRSIGKFKFQIDFRSNSNNSNLNIKLSISTTNSTLDVVNKQFNVTSNQGQIYDIGDINLYPSDNYITLEFSNSVYLNSLIFISIK